MMLPMPAAVASRTATVAHGGTDASLRASNRCNSWAAHCTARIAGRQGPLQRRGCQRLRRRRPAQEHPAAEPAKTSAAQRAVWAPAAQCAGGPAGTDRDAADAYRSGVTHRGSRTWRDGCNSPCQQPLQQHGRALHYPPGRQGPLQRRGCQRLRRRRPAQSPGCTAGRNNAAAAQWAVWAPGAQQGPTVMLPTPAAAASRTAAVAHAGTDAAHRAATAATAQPRTALPALPWPAGTAAAAWMPTSAPPQAGARAPAAQPAATTQLQLSGQCGRLGPSRTDRDAADACRSGVMHRGSRT